MTAAAANIVLHFSHGCLPLQWDKRQVKPGVQARPVLQFRVPPSKDNLHHCEISADEAGM
jgi:hypothetical protein